MKRERGEFFRMYEALQATAAVCDEESINNDVAEAVHAARR